MKNSLLKSLSLSFLLSMFLVSLIPVQAAITTTSISPCENCQSTTTTQVVPYSPKPGQFSSDLGVFNTSTSLTGFRWSGQPNQSLIMGLPSGCIPSAIQFNASLTMLQCPNLNLFFKPQGYQTTIILQGTGPSQVCLPLTSIGGNITYVSPTPNPLPGNPVSSTTAFLGRNIFDWGDIPASMNPNFDSQTNQLCYTPPAGPYSIDPIALDGSTSTCCASGSSFTLTLTTASSPDVLILCIGTDNAASYITVSSVSGDSLTWHNRAQFKFTPSGANMRVLEEWYAVASSTVSGVITINLSGNSIFTQNYAWGISGADTTTIFDQHAGLPAEGSGYPSGSFPSVSTNNANDMIIGCELTGATQNPTQGTGFTLINGGAGNEFAASEYKVVSATQSGLSVAFSNAGSDVIVAWGDAICQAGGNCAGTVTQPINILTLTAGAPSATISISGCAVSNATFTADGFTHTYSSVTASCTITLTEPADGTHTRYRFNVSPKPTAATSITFGTCGSGTCSIYSNSTYYQLNNNMTATPQNPTTWDGAYSWHRTDTFLGVSQNTNCATITNGGGVQGCQPTIKVWADYNTQSCLSTPIGNTWTAQAPNCFTHTAANNVDNVNYIQTTPGGAPNFNWLLLLPFGLLIFVVVLGRKKL